VRGLALFLLVLAIAATAVGAAGIAYSFFENTNLLVPSIALMVVPWAIWVPIRRLVTAQGKGPFEAALDTIEPQAANWYDGSGLALDRTNGKLLVGSRGEVAVHSIVELTEVEFVPEGAASVAAGGLSGTSLGAILALFAIGSATSAHVASGLYLTLGGRRWHVFGIGSEEAGLWMDELRKLAPHARFKEPA